jgi:hypothetical protein
MAISDSKGQKRFRFTLQNATQGLLSLRFTPGGWDTAKFEIKRNEKYMGLFRSISFNELTWRKDGRDFIRDVYESQGINALIVYTVTRLDDSTGTYLEYVTGKLDLSTYKISETGVTCQVIDTSFAEKVKNREGVKVNIRERISIEGYEVPAFTNEDPQLTIPAYNITAQAVWRQSTNDDSTLDNHYVALWLQQTDFTEAASQSADYTPAPGDGRAMFENSLADRLIHIGINIQGQVNLNSQQTKAKYTMGLYNDEVLVKAWGFDVNDTGWQIIFSVVDTASFTVLTGKRFYLKGSLTKSGTTIYPYVQVDIAETLSSVAGADVTAYPFWEATLRTLQLITDDQDVLESTYIGRTDSELITYPADGQLGHFTKGLFIRLKTGLNNTFSLSFADIFQALNSIYQIGMGIETVGGKNKVVIEELQYFFDSNVIIDLSSRVQENVIEKEVIPMKHYNQLETGYNTFEYLTTGGLAEFNTKQSFSTVISVLDNKLDLVCRLRADTQGIVNLRKNSGGDEDIKGDDDTFVIDSVRDGGDFVARTSEGFSLVTGGADADNCFNLLLTPKRNLLRHGQIVRAGLEKNLGTYLRWQAGEKNTTLITQLISESVALVENADILVDDLEESFYIPEYYTFECVMRYTDLTTILSNQKGLIKIGTDKYGWIMSLTIGEKENKADIKLLRCNLNKVTPT